MGILPAKGLDEMEELNVLRSKWESMEGRVARLEVNGITAPHYASTDHEAKFPSDQSSFIDKLEFLTSERKRETRLLCIVITRSSINHNPDNLTEHIIKPVFNEEMNMTNLKIDHGLSVSNSKA